MEELFTVKNPGITLVSLRVGHAIEDYAGVNSVLL